MVRYSPWIAAKNHQLDESLSARACIAPTPFAYHKRSVLAKVPPLFQAFARVYAAIDPSIRIEEIGEEYMARMRFYATGIGCWGNAQEVDHEAHEQGAIFNAILSSELIPRG